MKSEIIEEVKLESKPCPIGCDAEDEFIIKGHDLLHGLPGEFTVVRCTSCGLMRTNPRPTPDSMGFFYPEDYGPFMGTKVKKNQKDTLKGLKSRVLKPIVDFLFQMNTNRIPSIETGRLLEVGCASGSYMHRMHQRGWEVSGIEFSSDAAENARSLGYEVFCGTIEEAPQPDELFDLVVGHMVLEHLHDPVLALEKLNSWTKPGGWLVVSVPNAGSKEFQIFKDKWYALQLPTHTYHYTPDTISKLLAKCNWQVGKILYQRVLNNIFCSMGLELKSRGYNNRMTKWLLSYPKKSRMYNFALFPIGFLLSLFGQTGRMTIWAKKS